MFSHLLNLIALFGMSTKAVDISTDVNDLKFFHYPSSGERKELQFNNPSSLNSLKPGADTIIVIDGFLSDSSSPMSQITKDSAISRSSSTSTPHNVIVVDWGRLSGAGMPLDNLISTGLAYAKVLNNVGPVGARVAEFIAQLSTQKNIPPSQFTLVGHSLGAHIAGAAGSFYRQRHGGVVLGRITGLDPAGPFFSLQVDSEKRLHSGDGAFVDIYHTNRGRLGDSDHQTGDINVYVNGGDNQPGCETADSEGFAGFCSHSYSWKLYDASLYRGDILGCPCVGLGCQCKNNCNNNCPSTQIPVGAHAPSSARGAYHVTLLDPLVQYAQ